MPTFALVFACMEHELFPVLKIFKIYIFAYIIYIYKIVYDGDNDNEEQ